MASPLQRRPEKCELSQLARLSWLPVGQEIHEPLPPLPLWTTFMVVAPVRGRFGAKLSDCDTASRVPPLGCTPQRVIYRARHQGPGQRRWQEEEYCVIWEEEPKARAERNFGGDLACGLEIIGQPSASWGKD
jgi:hypothetical protein